MARLWFPQDRMTLGFSGTSARKISAGSLVEVFTDSAGTTPADCLDADGVAVSSGNPLLVDAYSLMPLWRGPDDGTDTLYVVVNGGPVSLVDARVDDRVDALDARVTAVEPGGDGAALQVASNLSDLDDAAAARTALSLGDSAVRDVGTGSGQVAAGDAPAAAAAAAVAGQTVDGTAGTGTLRTLGTGAQQAAGGRAALAQRVLASVTRPFDAAQVHPSPPTVALSAGNASPSIAGAVLVPQARASSTLIDVANDPHFEYVGIPVGNLDVSSGNKSYPALLQGGSSQSARHRVRFRFHFSGTEFEASFRQRTTSFTYRIWVDGLPLAADFATTAVTISQTYLLKVTFGAVGSRVVELEVVDPEFGGVWVEPTGTVTRTRLARPVLMGFGDSITGGANGVSAWNTWLRYCAQILGCDWVNTAIGGTGYLTGAGTSADFRQRITPDIASQAPDVLVLFGSYNDSGTYTQGQIQTEAEYVLGQLASQCPDTIVITVGCWQINDNAQAAFVAADNGVKAAAATAGVPFVSLCDPLLATGTAPAWAATTAYAVGDKVVANGWVQVCRTAHTSGASFAKTNWRASTFVNGTGRSGATVGDGNADVIVGTDGVHPTADGHRTIGYHLAQEITRHLRALAA